VSTEKKRMSKIDNDVSKRLTIDPMVGFPADVVRPNAQFSKPYVADRSNLNVTFHPSSYLNEQPPSIWWDDSEHQAGPLLMRKREPLVDGESLMVLDHQLHDLAVASPMVRVKRMSDGQAGYITLDCLITKTTAEEAIWAADTPSKVRELVEFPSKWGVLHSTNRVGPDEVKSSREYLSAFTKWSMRTQRKSVHPLECGAHSHRIGCWALDENRSRSDRNDVAKLLDSMMKNWACPKVKEVRPGVLTWPYEFDFSMPWGTQLPKPWYAGYANAAMLGSAACAYALTRKKEYKDIALGAFAFLKLPCEEGGALYSVDGFDFIAEYAYRTPPIPNYRVLDGELCSMPYLVNAGMLLDEPEMVSFAFRLNAGFRTSLEMLADPDNAPYFGMDGQAMQPNYMWQLWMCLQLLAAIFKDRSYTNRAKMWRPHIPESFVDEGYPF